MPSAQRTLRLAAIAALLCAPIIHAQKPHQVFAHYMLANRDYAPDDPTGEADIAAYQREIREAQSIGIDGFALNAGGWFKEPRYIRRATEMFEAATRLHTGFSLFFSADMCCSNDAADVEDMVRRFAGNPRFSAVYFRYQGKFLLTTFAGSAHGPQFWQDVRDNLEHGPNPLPIVFVPAFFFGGELPQPADISTGLTTYKNILDGAFYWGIAGVPSLGHAPDQLPSSAAYAAALHRDAKLYMAPICLQFWGANAGRYYEYSGFAGMRAMWLNAINITHPDWIEIITWNDFVEGTYVSPIANPIRDKPPGVPDTVHSHAGATELLKFFIAWYKTGHEPVIDRDAIYWAYRTELIEPKTLAAIRHFGPIADVVYATANLTQPATLHVSFGPHRVSIDLPAGSTDVQIPMLPGFTPHFELDRGPAKVAEANGQDPITPDRHDQDLYYSTGYMQAPAVADP